MPMNILVDGSNVKGPEPVVGMGATKYLYTDRHPYTIVEVISPKKIVVQADSTKADPDKPGGPGYQNWVITPNPDGYKETLTLRKDGKWRRVGESLQSSGYLIGGRDYYYCWES